MRVGARVCLVIIASLCGGSAAAAGLGFSNAVDPEASAGATALFWVAVGALFASPLWVPASVPARYPMLLRTARILGAAGALVLLTVFGTIAIHNIARAVSGRGADIAMLVLGLVTSAACVLGIVLLLRRARGGALEESPSDAP